MVELTTFSVNLDEIECFETVKFQVLAGGNGQSFVGTRDFSFKITSGASNISLSTNGTIFASATGKNVGTAKITVTYRVSGLSKTFEVDVVPYPFVIGMSTDNYTSGCGCKGLNSYIYADAFRDTFFDPLALGSNYTKNYIWHFNKEPYQNSIGASKNDFESTLSLSGEIASQADFMLYIGHGLQANSEKGNCLHYNHAEDGTAHDSNDPCRNDIFNLYTSEARFEHPRWVWLYTCNFLNTSQYVTDRDLVNMMNGTHILMGYETQSFLATSVSEKFASKLLSGEKIIESFFASGDEAERYERSDAHVQKVICIKEARDETIFSTPTTYDSNVYLIIRNRIKTDEEWTEEEIIK